MPIKKPKTLKNKRKQSYSDRDERYKIVQNMLKKTLQEADDDYAATAAKLLEQQEQPLPDKKIRRVTGTIATIDEGSLRNDIDVLYRAMVILEDTLKEFIQKVKTTA